MNEPMTDHPILSADEFAAIQRHASTPFTKREARRALETKVGRPLSGRQWTKIRKLNRRLVRQRMPE